MSLTCQSYVNLQCGYIFSLSYRIVLLNCSTCEIESSYVCSRLQSKRTRRVDFPVLCRGQITKAVSNWENSKAHDLPDSHEEERKER